MSLFKRLEERMRSRDPQNDSDDKEKARQTSDEEGGLFGSVSLGPANKAANVPPPADSSSAPTGPSAARRDVPSVEEARAEFDRARAQMGSGLFRRDQADEPTDAVLPVDMPSVAETDAPAPERESVSFGAVSLPVVSIENSPAELAESPLAESAPTDEDSSFKLPSLSGFADDSAQQKPVSMLRAGEAEAALSSEAIQPPALQISSLQTPEVVYNSTPTDESPLTERPLAERELTERPLAERELIERPASREVVARTESQVVSPRELPTVIEEMRFAPVAAPEQSAPAVESPSEEIMAEAQTPAAKAPTVETPSVAETLSEAPTVVNDPVAPAPVEEKSAPTTRAASNSNLTPFQRLMAARAAQGGPPVSRSRAERPASVAPASVAPTREETPVVPVPTVELPEIAAPAEIAPSALPFVASSAPKSTTLANETDAEIVPAVLAGTAPIERPEVELSKDDSDAVEAPQVETPQVETVVTEPSGAAHNETAQPDAGETPKFESVAVELPSAGTSEIAALQSEEPSSGPTFEVAPAQVADVELPTAAPEEERNDRFAAVELSQPIAAESAQESESAESPAMQKLEADAGEQTSAEVSVAREISDEESKGDSSQDEAFGERDSREAETVPERAANSADSGVLQEQEQAEEPVRVTPTLAERLAAAPRAELDAVRAEAESSVPDVLSEANAAKTTDAPEPARAVAPVSFAERLAARKRAQEDAASANAAASASVPVSEAVAAIAAPAPETATEAASAPESQEAQTVPLAAAAPDSMNFAPPAPPADEAHRSAPRSFSERLAARTGLDRHLQVPAEEAAPSQELANANTELARIDEGAQLSEREMKNRVLFRQKHLIFDSVIGSIDQRLLQNPTREAVRPQIDKGVDAAAREFNLNLEPAERNWMVDEFTRETTDLGALVPLLEDPSVAKIVVTGANDVSVERLGRIERTGVSFRDDDHLLSLVRRIAEMSGGRVDAKVPLLDRPLPDGGRIRAKVPPLAPQPTLTIEKSTGNPFVQLKRQMEEKSRGESLPYAQLRERIQQKLLREFEGDAASLAGDQDKLRGQVEEMIGQVIIEEQVVVTRAERASLVMDLLNEIVGLGPIEPLLNDPDVDEVMVNGPYQIYVERKGKLELTSARFRDNGHVMQVIDRIIAPLGRRVDEKSPMVDGRLRDGSRFNAVIPPLALSGPTMTIRKFARDPFTMSDLINFGSMTREAAQFLQAAVEGRLNIVVSGGTGSGKTTTLNVLSSFIPSTERIVTIEDAAELQMRQEHVIRMETRPPNIEGVGEVGIRDLVRNSLRMRPDRIVVGECRGGEALDMLQAMNTGHDGSLTTAHSNGPRDTCKRLETMVMMAGFDLPVRAIREQISMAVQLVVHQERMRDGKRRVTAITEIIGMEGDVLTMQDIFRFEQESIDEDGRIVGQLQATGMRPKHYETIVDNGVQLSMELFQPKPMGEAAPRARLAERGGR